GAGSVNLVRAEGPPASTTRSRFLKLAKARPKLKAIAQNLRAQGKDASPTAVVRELTQGDKKERRAERERELGAKQLAYPAKKYGVIVCDGEWDFEVWSRETGMDRHAANHYETAIDAHTAEELHERTKARFECAADDYLLAMWVPVPFLSVGIDLMRL